MQQKNKFRFRNTFDINMTDGFRDNIDKSQPTQEAQWKAGDAFSVIV